MENATSLRRQAEFFVRLSQFCLDGLFAERLRTMAAGSHERALAIEFTEEFGRAASLICIKDAPTEASHHRRKQESLR